MSSNSNLTFDKRSRQILRHRRQIARHGGEFEIGPDGLLTVRRKRRSTGFPLRGILMLTVLFFGAKTLMLAHDGPQSYGERTARLAQGGVVERAGAWVLQADPVSLALSEAIRPFLK